MGECENDQLEVGKSSDCKFLMLTHKDSDILSLATAREKQFLPLDFPPIITANLCDFATDEVMVDLMEKTCPTLPGTHVVIVVRLLGRGVPGFQHLLDVANRKSTQGRVHIIVVSGIPDSLEPDLTAMCNVSAETIHQVIAYFSSDGDSLNMAHMFRMLADHLLKLPMYGYNAPTRQPKHGLYHPSKMKAGEPFTITSLLSDSSSPSKPTVTILFYRCHYLSGNTAFVEALIDELEALNVNAVALFTESLRDHEPQTNINGQYIEKFPTALTHLLHDGQCLVDVLISTMAFAMGKVNPDGPTLGSWATQALEALNVPVLQAVTSIAPIESWQTATRGLNPLDTAMNVCIPEFDGRIITVPISFKAPQDETNQVHYYEPLTDRVVQVAKQAARLSKLRKTPNAEKRVSFMLTNSSGKAQRIGDAVGLDTPASIIDVFQAMLVAGYDLGDPDKLPKDGDALIQELVDRCSYDEIVLTEQQLANAAGHFPAKEYESMFEECLPPLQKKQMVDQWGPPPGEAYIHQDSICLAGLEFGNVFVALQPPRGYGMDPDKIYHTPDLPPPHNYFAIYKWLRDEWKADVMVHMGKHGTMEWLPGKGVGLSKDCYPDTFLDDMPLIYPFIINDPGEGTQAKRRAHALIIDHLCPPMTTAEGYGELAQLMQLVDEYYQVELLDPSKLPLMQQQIWELLQQCNLGEDLAFLLNHDHDHDHESHGDSQDSDIHDHDHASGYNSLEDHGHAHSHHSKHENYHEHNHEHKHEHSHRSESDCDHAHSTDDEKSHDHNHDASHDHDHVHKNSHEHQHDHDVLTDDDAQAVLAKMDGKDVAHLIETMDGYLCELAGAQIRDGLHILGKVPEGESLVDTIQALTRLANVDIPSLRQTISSVFELDYSVLVSNQGARLKTVCSSLVNLAGRPLASAGDAVETIDELAKHTVALLAQRNFDSHAIPQVIQETLELIESNNMAEISGVLQFVCDTLVPSLRDTTQEVMYLMAALDGKFVPGGPSGSPTRGMAHVLPTGRNFYAVDPNALPSMAAWEVGQGLAKEVLARYLRETSAYPEHVAISVWGTAAMRTHGDDIAEIFALLGIRPIWQRENHRVTGVELIPLSELGHPRIDVTIRMSGFFRDAFPQLINLMDDAVNLAIDADEPLEKNYVRKHYIEDMAEKGMGETPARYRVFGCPPGAYGIGILDLIEAQNWKDESDFAECYINWGGYAYSSKEPHGVEAKQEFTHRLNTVEVAIHNQDNREHDIFDSDDYFQFHGGMIATIKALSGKSPKGYFGDTQDPAMPKVRDIKEEALRVYRSRVVNPKWLESIRRHGYKGASEMVATVDYLFGFDATAGVISDFMYEQVAQSYALDKSTQEFYEESNPWALRGVVERLLEATQRGMWSNPDPQTLEALKQTILKADSVLEGRTDEMGD